MPANTANAFVPVAFSEGMWKGEDGKTVFGNRVSYKIRQYQGAGADFPVEGRPISGRWATKADAQAAADRATAGDETGIRFESFADD